VLPANEQEIGEAQLPAVVSVIARLQDGVGSRDCELRQGFELVAKEVPLRQRRAVPARASERSA
jgi:hypothetical protein